MWPWINARQRCDYRQRSPVGRSEGQVARKDVKCSVLAGCLFAPATIIRPPRGLAMATALDCLPPHRCCLVLPSSVSCWCVSPPRALPLVLASDYSRL